MQAALNRQQHLRILYDADQLQRPVPGWFEVDYWEHLQAVVHISGGRGGVCRVQTPSGAAALKRYLRGGQMSRISRDRYLFTGWERCRSFREWRLLAHMRDLQLPVPQPLAALCSRSGRRYQAALLTRWIDNAVPLHQRLEQASDAHADGLFSLVLQAIADLHAAGVYHPDLNFGNVLIDASDSVWLIDFDRARLLDQASRRHRLALPAMQARLLRSARRLQQDARLQPQHVLRLQELLVKQLD